MTEEKVNHPAHYGGADNPYEAIKVIEAWFPEGVVAFLRLQRDQMTTAADEVQKWIGENDK